MTGAGTPSRPTPPRPTSAPEPRARRAAGAGRDPRLFAEVFPRVSPPLIAALAPWLGQRPGTVLEIGAGSGQHAAACAAAFPALAWHASDPDPDHRASIRAWAEALHVPVHTPLDIDAAGPWADTPAVRALGPLDAVISINVVHITPLAVAEGIVSGAGRALRDGGLLIFYGPFHVHGRVIGPGNAAFDARLRAQDPAWGVRDVAEIEALGEAAGLTFAALLAMPANNRLLILRKA